MHLPTILAASFAGLVMATPVATSDLEKRGVLAELCIFGCLAGPCELNPAICAACLVTCIGTADAGEEVDVNGILNKIASGEVPAPQ